jgi:hypothetical protein
MDYAMQNDHNNAGHDDLAEIWNRAPHRRAEDIYSWLTQFLERTRRRESSAPAALQRMKNRIGHEGRRLNPLQGRDLAQFALSEIDGAAWR